MEIKIFEVGPFMENTYLLINGEDALLIDPGFANEMEFNSFKKSLNGSGASLKAIVLTHAHVDHVMGLQRTLKDFPVKVYLNTDDLFLWENFGGQAQMYGLNQVGFSFTPEDLPSAGKYEVASFQFECLYTPGHAPDHTSIYFKDEGILISGDAIFRESIGRTDLYKGDFNVLEESIREKIFTLPDSTVIYSGHGPATTVGHEKRHNPFVRPIDLS